MLVQLHCLLQRQMKKVMDVTIKEKLLTVCNKSNLKASVGFYKTEMVQFVLFQKQMQTGCLESNGSLVDILWWLWGISDTSCHCGNSTTTKNKVENIIMIELYKFYLDLLNTKKRLTVQQSDRLMTQRSD